MSDRRYEVYEVRECDCGYSTCDRELRQYRLSSIPDDLLEEAEDAIDALGFDTLELRNWGDDSVANATELVARAALSVLFPGEEGQE